MRIPLAFRAPPPCTQESGVLEVVGQAARVVQQRPKSDRVGELEAPPGSRGTTSSSSPTRPSSTNQEHQRRDERLRNACRREGRAWLQRTTRSVDTHRRAQPTPGPDRERERARRTGRTLLDERLV